MPQTRKEAYDSSSSDDEYERIVPSNKSSIKSYAKGGYYEPVSRAMTTPQRRRDTDIQSKDLQNESRFKPKQLAFDEIYDGKDSSRYARGSGAVPSAEEGISQGDMLIEAKQKRM